MNLHLTDLDDKPIPCQWAKNITDYSISLVANKLPTGSTVTIDATITDAATGLFEFQRLADTFESGTYSAHILTVDGNGFSETSDSFYINVAAR